MMAGGTKQSFPRWWQGLIILVSGIVIGLSSCAAFLNGLNYGGGGSNNQAASGFFAIGFFAGIAVALVGLILMLIGIARAAVNAMRPPPAPALLPQPGTQVFATGAPAATDDREQRVLRQFQIVLVVFMLLPAASI